MRLWLESVFIVKVIHVWFDLLYIYLLFIIIIYYFYLYIIYNLIYWKRAHCYYVNLSSHIDARMTQSVNFYSP